ncbi:MAG: hypothetical protein PHQ54_01235, partial [Candidatus Omnitrophica bacterium]|nr:hypothetical protein [Candidatus Omnitrophota bacterium]
DYFRMRNPDDYVRELEYHWSKYKNRNLRLFQMFDPVFTINSEWLEKFCQGYRKSSLIKEIKYSIFARIDNLNEEKLKLLSSSGCALLRIGIECGNEQNRKNIYKKSVSNRQIESIFQLAKYYNIAITAFYILGGPGETVKSIKETISFADRLKAERSAFFIYKPFTQEGVSQIYQMGGRVDSQKWEKSDNITFQAAIYTKELSPEQIESYQRLAYIITFGKRLTAMIARQNVKYFIRLLIYTTKGIINGLDIKYLLTYYHIYSYDNIDR